jgi:oxysterol-binding protein-related protein 9/10/11
VPLFPFFTCLPTYLPAQQDCLITNAHRPKNTHPEDEQYTIIDIGPLSVAPKVIPPEDQQLPQESLTLWSGVTKAILSKQYAKATTVKQELEEQQRVKAREREAKGEVWKPVFFEQVTGNGGKPELTEKGKEVLRRAQRNEWSMEGVAT